MNNAPATRLAGGRLELFSPRPYAQVRLFCFPYAGGRPQAFRSWSLGLPRGCELLGVSYPGRGNRLGDPPLWTARDLALEATDSITGRSDLPFVLFGHSMGALVAFEVVRELRRRGCPGPACLFVSGQAAPHLPIEAPAHSLSDEAFLDRLRAMGGTPPEVLESEELMQLLLPAIRADFYVCDTYAYELENPLDTPIVAFAAVDDSEVSTAHVDAWRDQTSTDFDIHLFAGGHFFMHSAEQAVLQALASSLRNRSTQGRDVTSAWTRS